MLGWLKTTTFLLWHSSCIFRGGSALEPLAKRGVTQLMTGLLEEGSGEMDAQAFAAAKEGLAVSFGYRAYQDVLGYPRGFLRPIVRGLLPYCGNP